MEREKLINRLNEMVKYHLSPYNLGDEGETIKLINEAIKQLNEVAVDSGEVCTCTIFHSYKERHENLCSKTGKRIF